MFPIEENVSAKIHEAGIAIFEKSVTVKGKSSFCLWFQS